MKYRIGSRLDFLHLDYQMKRWVCMIHTVKYKVYIKDNDIRLKIKCIKSLNITFLRFVEKLEKIAEHPTYQFNCR